MLDQFDKFLYRKKVYRPDQIEDVLKQVRPSFRFSQRNQKHKYFNVPCAFDTETTSFYNARGDKCGITYAWTFGIYGLVIFGRTMAEFVQMIYKLSELLDLDAETKRLCVYVHNLAFDFQFFRKFFEWEKVFAIDRRKPLYALADIGVEFRCSYMLSGYNLAALGNNLVRFKVQKQVGDLDYSLVRHEKTPLTQKEIRYCADDVRVVMAYIAEEILREGGLSKLPLTKTGYVRNYCRNACFYVPGEPHKKSRKRLKYRQLIKSLTLDADTYRIARKAFLGGFTHANALYSGRLLENVTSWDLCSSYPTVMLSERFPMSTPVKIDTEALTQAQFYELLQYYNCFFTVRFIGLKERPDVWENYISVSHCGELVGHVENNGRVVSADSLTTTITEVDFNIIRKMYTWDCFYISEMYTCIRGWLPKDFKLAILKLYEDKTTLKGVAGKEVEYLIAKGMLNSCYGMTVTAVIREVNDYEGDWLEPYMPDADEELLRYNTGPGRFLYYLWGVYVTAYARRNLFSAILECGPDYVYSDTDSVKILNAADHEAFFVSYNKDIINRLEYALKDQGISPALIRPKTIKGVQKPLGVWENEGTYSRFKTLGAKRYLVEHEGALEMTVAGVNKKTAVPWMLEKYGDNTGVFEAFRDGLNIPPGACGKQTHTYIDDERCGMLTDYKGIIAEYVQPSGIHLEEAGYQLGLSGRYIEFLLHYARGERYL